MIDLTIVKEFVSQSHSWKIHNQPITYTNNFCIMAKIPWNSADILSTYKKPVTANGPVGISITFKRAILENAKTIPQWHSRG